jgi:hypothetical protein
MWVLPLISKIEAEKCVLLLVRPREREIRVEEKVECEREGVVE